MKIWGTFRNTIIKGKCEIHYNMNFCETFKTFFTNILFWNVFLKINNDFLILIFFTMSHCCYNQNTLVWTQCIMHPVDPPTRSFAFPIPVHFHLLRPLEPHPHLLPPFTKKIKIMTLLNPYPKKNAPKSPHPPSKSQKYLPHRPRELLRENGRKSKSKK